MTIYSLDVLLFLFGTSLLFHFVLPFYCWFVEIFHRLWAECFVRYSVYLEYLLLVCCRSVTELCLTLCNPMNCRMPGFPVLHYLLEFAQSHVHGVSDTIQPSHPLSPPSPFSLNLSLYQGLFQWVTLHIRWPKYWSFSFSISPSNAYSRLISFRIDWFDLLAVQGTLKSLLQHHSSKTSVLQLSAFFMVQLLYLYMTTGKTIALTTQNFVDKVMSLHFSTLGLSSLFFQETSIF